VLSGRGLCDGLIAHPEESYRLCCVVVCDLETSGIGAPYIYDISHLRVNKFTPLFDSVSYIQRTKINVLYFLHADTYVTMRNTITGCLLPSSHGPNEGKTSFYFILVH
jgi:hypothetical protein